MRKLLIFDMDGTITDLYGVHSWLEKLRNEDATPYLEALPLVNMIHLTTVLKRLQAQGWEVAVTSWLAMDSTEYYKKLVREAKKEWLLMFDFPFDELHLVQYGTPKQKCTKGDVQILFDDSEAVRRSFENEGKQRYAINPLETDILQFLEELV